MASNNAAAEQETFLDKKKKRARAQGLRDFLKSTDAKGNTYYLGRTGKSWGQIIGFYIVFYACLAGFFAICLAVFMETSINSEAPRWYGQGNIIGNRPGLGFQPWLLDEPDSTLIKFDPHDNKTFAKYVRRMRNFLKAYYDEKVETDKGPNCDGHAKDRQHTCDYAEMISRFLGIGGLEDLENHQFGYDQGKPIVALTLNRLMGYTPQPFATEGDLRKHAKDITEGDVARYDTEHVLVVCDGQYPADQDNIGPVRYKPPGGFPLRFFPYRKYAGREHHWGYHQPVVFVQFENLRRGAVVLVECRALGSNVEVNRYYKLGISHFELVVDDVESLKRSDCAGSRFVEGCDA